MVLLTKTTMYQRIKLMQSKWMAMLQHNRQLPAKVVDRAGDKLRQKSRGSCCLRNEGRSLTHIPCLISWCLMTTQWMALAILERGRTPLQKPLMSMSCHYAREGRALWMQRATTVPMVTLIRQGHARHVRHGCNQHQQLRLRSLSRLGTACSLSLLFGLLPCGKSSPKNQEG